MNIVTREWLVGLLVLALAGCGSHGASSGNGGSASNTGGSDAVTHSSTGSGITGGSDTDNSTTPDVTAAAQGPAVLQADSTSRSVILSWTSPAPAIFNVYTYTHSGCNVSQYSSCPNGSLATGVTSPFSAPEINNDTIYYYRVESVFPDGTHALSNEAAARPTALSFDGIVRAIAVGSDGTAYVGGTFTRAGASTGGAIPFDATSGRFSRADFPMISGEVDAVAADGTGGWYVGGTFAAAGNTNGLANLAHVLADGTVDPNWIPFSDGPVRALIASGNIVYVGGSFTGIAAGTHPSVVALDGHTGQLLPGWTDPKPNGPIQALALVGNVLYIGGNFSSLGATPASGVSALDAHAGTPSWYGNVTGVVFALAASNTAVYVGGFFMTVSGQSHPYLAALNPGNGTPLSSWTLSGVDSAVYALTLSGGTLYVGGNFTHVNNLQRRFIAALNVAGGGSVATWAPVIDNTVWTLSKAGNVVYAGGDFKTATSASGSATRNYAAAFDATTGFATTWNPNPDGEVRTFATNATTVYAGGKFSSAGAMTLRNNLAAIDSYGSLLPWNPNADGQVSALAVSDNVVYAGGSFHTVGARAKANLAALDPTSGALVTSWTGGALDGPVYALQLSGNTIYVGGDFLHVGAGAHSRLAALNSSTGAPVAGWNAGVNGTVDTLSLSGTRLFVGGSFSDILAPHTPAIPYQHAAAFNIADGTPTQWAPEAGTTPGSAIYCMKTVEGQVFMGGAFSGLGPPAITGQASGAPGPGPAYLTATDDGFGYGTSSLNSEPNGDTKAMVLNVFDDRQLYVGGSFTKTGPHPPFSIPYLALFFVSYDVLVTDWHPRPSGPVYALGMFGDVLYVGGDFLGIGGAARGHFAAVEAGGLGNALP
jgi:hypothetical protein